MNKQAAIYARVSTDEQAERGYSLESQLEACQDYAAAHGLEIQRKIADNYTGAKLDRPGLDTLRADIEERTVEAVSVYSPDRLTGNLAHSLILCEELQRAGIELHYCDRGKSDAREHRGRLCRLLAGPKIIEGSRRGRLGRFYRRLRLTEDRPTRLRRIPVSRLLIPLPHLIYNVS
jgi:site-specific DNA recombinase